MGTDPFLPGDMTRGGQNSQPSKMLLRIAYFAWKRECRKPRRLPVSRDLQHFTNKGMPQCSYRRSMFTGDQTENQLASDKALSDCTGLARGYPDNPKDHSELPDTHLQHSPDPSRSSALGGETLMTREISTNTERGYQYGDDQIVDSRYFQNDSRCLVPRQVLDTSTGPNELSPDSSDNEADCIPDIETILEFEDAVLSTMMPTSPAETEVKDKLCELRELIEGKSMKLGLGSAYLLQPCGI